MDCCKDEKKHDNHKEHGSHGCCHDEKKEHSGHGMKSMEGHSSSHKH